MLAHGAEAERVRVCHTNIDPAHWRADPVLRSGRVSAQEMGQALPHKGMWAGIHAWDDTRPIVLYAGRMCAQKQPQVFVDTVQQLRLQDAPLSGGCGWQWT